MSSAAYAVFDHKLDFSLLDRKWVIHTGIDVNIVDLGRSSFRAIESLFDTLWHRTW